MLGVSFAYLALCALWRKPIAFAGYHLRPPSLSLAIAQVALASIDAVVASTVIYALLPDDLGLSYQSFLPVYLIAATASVLSLVPGDSVFSRLPMTMSDGPALKGRGAECLFRVSDDLFHRATLVRAYRFIVHEARGQRALRSLRS